MLINDRYHHHDDHHADHHADDNDDHDDFYKMLILKEITRGSGVGWGGDTLLRKYWGPIL